jgi:hypothetical protein
MTLGTAQESNVQMISIGSFERNNRADFDGKFEFFLHFARNCHFGVFTAIHISSRQSPAWRGVIDVFDHQDFSK